MHENAELLFRKYAIPHLGPQVRVLEIGPDLTPSTLQSVADGKYACWDTADLRGGPPVGGSLTYTMDDENVVPAADDSYDLIVSSSVIEHVRRPWQWLPELARICRPGGRIITISPVSWPEHKNEVVPFDCWRIMPDGLRVLAEDAGLEVAELRYESLEPASRRSRWHGGETYRFLAPKRSAAVSNLVDVIDTATRRSRSAAIDCITIAVKPLGG